MAIFNSYVKLPEGTQINNQRVYEVSCFLRRTRLGTQRLKRKTILLEMVPFNGLPQDEKFMSANVCLSENIYPLVI